MDASESTGGGSDDDDEDLSPTPLFWESQTGIHAVSQTCHLLCTRRGVELIKTESRNTHINIACFLACLKAARVWSLLKSPESDSKMSSIKIPAFDLHNVFDRCVDA